MVSPQEKHSPWPHSAWAEVDEAEQKLREKARQLALKSWWQYPEVPHWHEGWGWNITESTDGPADAESHSLKEGGVWEDACLLVEKLGSGTPVVRFIGWPLVSFQFREHPALVIGWYQCRLRWYSWIYEPLFPHVPWCHPGEKKKGGVWGK